jgi:RHS repeat-associated protein
MHTVARWRFFLGIGLCFIAFLSLDVRTSFAQQPLDDFSQTLPPFGSFSGSDFDIVSLQNGNLHLSIPMINIPQRGGTTFSYKFMYDTPLWDYSYVVLAGKGSFKILADSDSLGWHFATPSSWSVQPFQTKVTCVNGNDTSINYRVVDPEGVKHPFYLNNSGGICSVPTTRGPAFDGSGLILDVGTGGKGLIFKDGSYPGEDNNGNIFDTLNRTIFTTTSGPSIPFTTPLEQTTRNHAQYELDSYQDSNGATQTYRIDYTGVDVHTGLCGNAPPNFCNDTIVKTAVLPSRLTLPNGTYYQFTWVNNSQEQIQRIDLPTGAYITYMYKTQDECELQSDGLSRICRIPVISRAVVQGGVTSTWNYNAGTVTDPYGNDEVHAFNNLQVGNAVSSGTVETGVSYYSGSSGSGVLLKKVANTYTGEANPLTNSDVMNIRLIQRDTTLDNGQTRSIQTDYETFPATACQLNFCSAATATRMNPTAMREYDYGTNAPGLLLRTTNYLYLHTNNQTYINANIVDRVTAKTILNGVGTQVAQTQYEYDIYSHPGQPMLASGAVQHDPTYSTSNAVRGNVTAKKVWRNTDGALLTTTNQYDDAGSLLSSIDPLGNKTTFDYTDSWSNATCAPSGGQGKAYVTTVTNALGQPTLHSYNSCTGTLASTKDPNLQTTSFTYDAFGRRTLIGYPDGGQVSNSYNDAPSSLSVTTTTKITSSLNKVETSLYDALGRISETQLTSDPEGATVFSAILYDLIGRKSKVYNSTRCTPPTTNCGEPTWGYTSYAYDALNRTTQVTQPDTSLIQTSYTGNSTTVTDEAGKKRTSVTDGLGRLTHVIEDPSILNYQTVYTYDALDDLATVVQGGSHNRSFTSDSLRHLISSTNPEAGTVTYTYDNDRNVLTKKDARNITITYGYDPLNRLTGKTYSNGDPAVTYSYDQPACLGLSTCQNIGHRTSMTDAAGSEAWSFNVPLRTQVEQRITNGVRNSATSVDNLDGSLATLTYPSGRTITYTPDAAARPISAVDTANSINYATGASYAPIGALSELTLGSAGSFTGINLSNSYNTRLQPNELKAWSTAGTAMDLSYNFVDTSSHNNGNVIGITNNKDNTRSQQFTYDSLNRILTAKTTSTSGGNCWGLNFGYDQWANLTAASVSQCTASMLSVTVNGNNQIASTGFSYDASGNLLADGTNTYGWNAESEIKSVPGVNYTYDGDGNRVQKSNGKIYWYGAGSEVLDESDAAGNFTDEYVYFGGKRIAHRVISGNSIYYYAEDFLGSSRVITTATGTVCYEADFYPYGGERNITNNCPQNYKFEGKERDAETNNDDFGARYYSSQFGRWTSPDWSAIPEPVPYANLINPQTLNLYAMVHDNPETFADLDGHIDLTIFTTGVGQWNQLFAPVPPGLSDAVASCLANKDLCDQGPAAQQAGQQNQNAGAAPSTVTALDKTMEEIDAVVKPLIESASKEVAPIIEEAAPIIGGIAKVAGVAAAVVIELAGAPAANANEGKLLQQARAAEDAQNSSKKYTNDKHTKSHPSRPGGDKLRKRDSWNDKKFGREGNKKRSNEHQDSN